MKPLRHELAVVVPAGQHPTDIGPLIERLERALAGMSWEAVFFASDDATVDAVTRASQGRENLRCLPGSRDGALAKLCAEGLLATSSANVAVMDTDLRHDESLLPRMSLLLREARLDAVIATCAMPAAESEEAAGRRGRARRRIIGSHEGPPSEFFVMRREFMGQALRNLGGRTVRSFHDLLAAAPAEVRFQIMPYDPPRRRSRARRDFRIFASHPIERFMPSRTARFGVIGAAALAVHMATSLGMMAIGGHGFAPVQAGAALAALIFTFIACNLSAPAEHRLSGSSLARGALAFGALAALGLGLNVYAADLLYQRAAAWPVAALLGGAIGWVWNLTVGASFVWRPREEAEAATPRGAGAGPRAGLTFRS